MKFGDIKKYNVEFQILPNYNNDFEHLTLINGLYVKDGGTPVDYVLNKIIYGIRDKLIKKYKTIKPGDIKSKLKLYINMRFVKNLKFNSQTKEKVTNNIKDFDEYFKHFDWNKIQRQILKDKDIIENITSYFEIKEKANELRELKKQKRNKKRLVSDKYTPSIGDKEILFLCEGDSAASSLMKILGRKGKGYISMMGIPMNAWEENPVKISKSKKFLEIQDVCVIDYVEKKGNPEYDIIAFATDADLYGSKIKGLLIAYFYKFGYNIIKNKKLKIFRTPLIFAFDKKDNLKNWFYDFKSYREYEKDNPNLNYEYAKGLGRLSKKVMEQIIEKEGFSNLLVDIEDDEESLKIIDLWFNKKYSDKRKDKVKANPFNINMM